MNITKSKTKEPELQNYLHGFDPIQLHYFGGYMSFSSSVGDFISRPSDLTPFKVFKNEKFKIGEKQEIQQRPAVVRRKEQRDGDTITMVIHTGETPEQVIVTVPVYETKRLDVTPPFKAYGSPIALGDRVRYGLVSGTLAELTDNHFCIDAETGKHYFTWAKAISSVERA